MSGFVSRYYHFKPKLLIVNKASCVGFVDGVSWAFYSKPFGGLKLMLNAFPRKFKAEFEQFDDPGLISSVINGLINGVFKIFKCVCVLVNSGVAK